MMTPVPGGSGMKASKIRMSLIRGGGGRRIQVHLRDDLRWKIGAGDG